MSLSLYRIIEVKREAISDIHYNSFDELKEAAINGNITIGVTYKIDSWQEDKKYKLYKGMSKDNIPEFEESDKCKYYWEVAEVYTNYNKYHYSDDIIAGKTTIFNKEINLKKYGVDEICTNFKDNFRGYQSDNFEYGHRGLPEDVSEEAKALVEEYEGFNTTYLTIDDMNAYYTQVYNKWKGDVITKLSTSTDINDKLDYIISALKDPFNNSLKKTWETKDENNEEYYEDSIDYLFNEEYWNIESINQEINIMNFIAELSCGILGQSGIRAIYWAGC